MLLLKNGIVHTMNGDPFIGDVLIRDGKIHAAAARLEAPEAEVLDVSGCHVIPMLRRFPRPAASLTPFT